MSILFLLACAGDPIDSAADSASSDSEVPDLAPTLSAEVARLGGAVGSELSLELSLEDEDPEGVELSVSLGEELATGDFDGSTWVGTASTPGLTTMTVTATDASGQSATLQLPLEVWQGRSWSGFMPLQSPDDDVPSTCIGMSREGWTYVAGWAGAVGLMLAIDPAGEGWMQTFFEETEYGRCGAFDESNGHVLYVGERYPSARGVVRSVAESGLVWESEAPWEATTAYWVDARDGVAAVAGTYADSEDNERGGWVQLYDSATGEAQGEPIVLGATDTGVRTEPSSVQLLEDGSVLTGSWGYWDWEADSSAALYSGWVQIAEPGEVVPEPLIVVASEEGNVYLSDALQLSDGRIAVVGETAGELVQPLQGHSEGYLMVFEADGSLAWGYQKPSTSAGRFLDLAEGPDGRIYVAADAGNRNDRVEALAFETDGSLAWESTVVEGGVVMARGISVMGEDIVLTGMFEGDLADPPIPGAGGLEAFLVRLDTEGDVKR